MRGDNCKLAQLITKTVHITKNIQNVFSEIIRDREQKEY
jgi:hypothetical protein